MATRSGKQNIAEGSKASKTSTGMELKLTNGARASLEELLVDYQDYREFAETRPAETVANIALCLTHEI